jgi:hypothetical protein
MQPADHLWPLSAATNLEVGTPEELAATGSLTRFIEGRGIHFHPETLTISVDK